LENYIIRHEFEDEWGKLVDWFNPRMTQDKTTVAFNKLRFYPLDGLRYACDYFVENCKPTPGQFPTVNEIINIIYKWLDMNPEEKFKRMEFDPYEDFAYPLSKLWDGYKVLVSRGEKAFRIFAENNRMPKQDRERVIMKYKVSRAGKEMPDLTQKVGKIA